jgi:hypothetical protein
VYALGQIHISPLRYMYSLVYPLGVGAGTEAESRENIVLEEPNLFCRRLIYAFPPPPDSTTMTPTLPSLLLFLLSADQVQQGVTK